MLKKIYFSCQIISTIGERPNKKKNESLDLTRKGKLLTLPFMDEGNSLE